VFGEREPGHEKTAERTGSSSAAGGWHLRKSFGRLRLRHINRAVYITMTNKSGLGNRIPLDL